MDRHNGVSLGENYGMSGLGDSYYEYLLKAWIQGGKKEKFLKSMYDEAVEGLYKNLLGVSKIDGYYYIGERKGNRLIKNMNHLTCFAGGMLAQGSFYQENPKKKARDLEMARALAYTCYRMYSSTPTGLSPAYATFADDTGMQVGMNGKAYKLNPETIETLYILYTRTKDPIYIEWAYDIYKAIETNCKTVYGYGDYPDVTQPNLSPMNKMESFFPAETLKYLYLLFKEKNGIDFEHVVFNSECHPLSVYA